VSRIRLVGGSAVVAAALLLATTPIPAYRVLLDHDVDDDLTTFKNDVFEALQVPITLVVALSPEDTAGTWVHFSIAWDCTDVPFDLSIPHGAIHWEKLPDVFPFTNINMAACTGIGCECMATRVFEAQVTATAPGVYALGVVPFERFAQDPVVTFELSCGPCSYLPEDEGRTQMVFWDDVVGVQGEVASRSWGRVKAKYLEGDAPSE
jgi:hypothetical protein